MIELVAVTKRFGKRTAVDGVTLSMAPGRIFGIIGPNGAGKTTLFRLICKLIMPDSGHIAINGKTAELEVKRQVGYLPEEHRLYEHVRTRDYLRYFCDLAGTRRSRADDILRYIGLEDRANQKIATLSKGMRQKLSFGRALLTDPPVLVLDEPTYGLDPNTSREVRRWIRAEARAKTVLLSSHNLHEAQRVCDRVAILHRGRVVAKGTPAALIESYRDEVLIDVDFVGDPQPLARALEALPCALSVAFDGNRATLAFASDASPYRVLRSLLDAIESHDEPIVITRIAPREPTLEDVFFKVTGERYADADTASSDRPDPGEPPGAGDDGPDTEAR